MIALHHPSRMLLALLFTALPAFAGTIYVDHSNPSCPGSGTLVDPFCAIQLAIENAVNGDVIEVAPGTNNESPKVNGLVLTIRGTLGRDVTTVQGDGTQAVFTATGDADLTIEGLTITGGFGPDISTSGGGIRGFLCGLTVTNSTLTGNSAFNGGAGIYFAAAAGKKLTVTGSTISNNSAGVGGAIGVQYGAVDIDDSLIENNYASAGGGAIFRLPGLLTVTSSLIRNNSTPAGGGAFYLSGGDLTLTNSTVTGNSAGSQGTAVYGAGLFGACDISILNSTVAGNSGSSNGAITLAGSPSPPHTLAATNAIVWGNAAPALNLGSATANITFSDIEGGFAGTGNINSDPKFLDAANGDYRLAYDSPCIDAGTNLFNLPATDIEGDKRKIAGDSTPGAQLDMGSDEFDVLWKVNLPAVGNYNFTAMGPPSRLGNPAILLLSLGDGGSTPGIPVPLSSGQKIHLDSDPLFNLWLGTFASTAAGTVALATPPNSTATVPSTPGFTIYYAGVMIDLGTGKIPVVTPTHSYVTQ